MTTKPRHTNRLARRSLLLVTGIVAGSLLLSGCIKTPTDTPATPTTSVTATPTPTSTTPANQQEAPKSDSEAIRAAETTIVLFYKIRGEINAAGGVDSSPYKSITTGNAYTIMTADAGRLAADQDVVTGAITFTPDSAYTGTLTDSAGKTYPFSTVQVTGCQDGSSYVIKKQDGTAVQQPTQLKNELEITVIFDPKASSWFVQNLTATGKSC